jgi:hypothetical protein
VVAPGEAKSDSNGMAEFLYTASTEQLDCRVTIYGPDYPDLQTQIMVTQASAHYYQVQWDDLPDSPVAKVYIKADALERGQDLTPDAVEHVRVLNSDKTNDYSGRVPDEAWRTVAIIGRIGFNASNWQLYSRIARQFFNAGKALRQESRGELHNMQDFSQHLEHVTEGLKQGLSTLSIGPDWHGGQDLLDSLASFVENANSLQDLVGMAESQLPEWTGDAPEVVWDRRNKEWSRVARQEMDNLEYLRDLSEKLHEHWMGISPTAGPGLTGWQVAVSSEDIWEETDAYNFWQTLLESIDLQMKKSEVFLAELHSQVAELNETESGSGVAESKKAAINQRRMGLENAKTALNQLKFQLQREIEQTERYDMLARVLATR